MFSSSQMKLGLKLDMEWQIKQNCISHPRNVVISCLFYAWLNFFKTIARRKCLTSVEEGLESLSLTQINIQRVMSDFLFEKIAWRMEGSNTTWVLLFFLNCVILLGKWCWNYFWNSLVWLYHLRERRLQTMSPILKCLPHENGPLLVVEFEYVWLIAFMVSISEGFQWSYQQQANHVINVVAGSNVSLPCDYVLTPQEEQQANIFHLLTWSREQPYNSDEWAGLAINSTLIGSKVIYDHPQHIFISDRTLNVMNVAEEDHTRYQCSFRSSFFTSPSIIELNVQCKYYITLRCSES